MTCNTKSNLLISSVYLQRPLPCVQILQKARVEELEAALIIMLSSTLACTVLLSVGNEQLYGSSSSQRHF